jgi:hypothetical protein
MAVTVRQYPTGASKWNPVEHRLFSEISKNRNQFLQEHLM